MQGGWKPTKVRFFEGKTAAPTVNDDQNDGYQVSDIWMDETNDASYQLVDATAGSAVWTQIGGSGQSHDAMSDVSADDHHAQSHDAPSHSDLTSSGAVIEAAVSASHPAVTLNASATTGGLSLSTQEISNRAASNTQTGYATAAQITKLDGIATSANLYVHPNHSGDVTSVADGAQTLANKQTMSATAPITLSNTPTVVAAAAPVIAIPAATASVNGYATSTQITKLDGIAAGAQPGTVTSVTGTSPVASSGGTTPAISIPAATNAIPGHATAAHIQAIEANTAKNTNVSTALSVGTVGINTVAITSDGGVDDVILPAATVDTAGMLTTAKWAEIITNNGKVTNANHSGDATGATALTIAAGAVTLAKMANMATASLIYRKTAAAGVPEVNTLVTLKTDLGLTGTNSGDNAGVTAVTGTAPVASSGGATPAISMTAATNAAAGYATAAHITAIEANTTKATNVSTALSVGTVGVNTVAITSDGGADDVTLPAATVNTAGMLTTAKWAEIVTNTGKTTNATHSGEVTGSAALTITNEAVTLAKMANMATASLLGRNTAGVGVPEVLAKATVLSLLNVADGANLYVHPNHSGEVTSAADGAQTIATAAVTLAKMANMATASLIGRNTAATGVPEVLSKATALSLLNVADGADVTSTNETSHADVVVDGDIGSTVQAYDVNITTLVNDSMADALHRHSELSASDGTPNPALSVDAAGNVGIGTTSPGAVLHVKDALGGHIRMEDSRDGGGYWHIGASVGALGYFGMKDDTVAAVRMVIDDSGNVGIGTITPTSKVHVDQISTTAAIPALYLDQADVSEEMIEFNTTIGTGNAIEALGSKVMTPTHFIKTTVPGGLSRYLEVGTIATGSRTSGLVDVVQGYDAGIATNDTIVLTFAFIPSKIVLAYSGVVTHDTTGEDGHTTGHTIVTITGTDTYTKNAGSVSFTELSNGSHYPYGITGDYLIYMYGGTDVSDTAIVTASGAWVTATRTLTLTFTIANADANYNKIEILATAYA